MTSSTIRATAAGALVANAAPHLASAIARRRHLTPLAGRDSGAIVNGVWAALNLLGGAVLLRPARRAATRPWDGDLLAFEAGYVAFAAWMAGSERLLHLNAARG